MVLKGKLNMLLSFVPTPAKSTHAWLTKWCRNIQLADNSLKISAHKKQVCFASVFMTMSFEVTTEVMYTHDISRQQVRSSQQGHFSAVQCLDLRLNTKQLAQVHSTRAKGLQMMWYGYHIHHLTTIKWHCRNWYPDLYLISKYTNKQLIGKKLSLQTTKKKEKREDGGLQNINTSVSFSYLKFINIHLYTYLPPSAYYECQKSTYICNLDTI